jgi:UDP-N-acetyl-2-amino-2-deoxyglucuronate dehydrogenase
MPIFPPQATAAGKTTYRSLRVDGAEVEFSDGFTDLHTEVYRAILAGKGFTIEDARASIELAYRIRTTAVTPGSPFDSPDSGNPG